MIYIMSDLHGALDEFKEMLEVININFENDHLYLLGDYVDWGEKSIETLLCVMELDEKYPNVHVTIGNHDEEFRRLILNKTLLMPRDFEEISYVKRNGVMVTINGYLKLDQETKIKIIEYLNNIDVFFEVEVNDKNYYLTHSAPVFKSDYDAVWYRRSKGEKLLKDGRILVHGHTITKYYQEDGDSWKIFFDKTANAIDIDCGAKAFSMGKSLYPKARLACIRLDDLKEYYVK